MEKGLRQHLKYTGTIQPKMGEQDPKTGQLLYPYLPDDSLIEAVNLAIFLQRPLLLKGEPGCGKTRLAKAIAYELELPFESWYVKSTSRARDGLYIYDSVGRLRDSQLAANKMLDAADLTRTQDPNTYIRWRPLGKAFRNSQRTILLIDEIDKADIDFPNDLLLELDEQRFIVEETGEEVRTQFPPIVLITSNDEKVLSDAFLRRCIFHYIEFPDRQKLIDIINAIFPRTSDALVNRATTRFLQLREIMQADEGITSKNVSTSELVEWFTVLEKHPEDEALAKLNGQLPYPGVLLKSWEAHQRCLSLLDTKNDYES